MKIRCLIVDDEPLAIRVIKKHCSNVQDIEVIASCENAVEAFSILQKHSVDLLFLDIQMPELSGLELLRTLPNPPHVIITTAYREYALEGYDLDVTDYLLKPISFERFLKAIQKVYRRMDPDQILQQKIIQSKPSNEDEFLLARVKNKFVKVFLNDILYVESIKDYVRIKTPEREIVTKISISEMEKNLSGSDFIRIHRSFIVPLNKIDSFSPTEVEIGNVSIPVGRSYKTLMLKRLQNNDF